MPSWLIVFLPLGVAAVTLIVFAPALHNGFVNWDDDKLLLENHAWRGLGGPQLRWMFSRGMMGHYHPLTWLTFAIDYRLWGGLDPGGFHLTSVVVHALNAALFYLLALRLLRMCMPRQGIRGELSLRLGAVLAALLFAVHPLRVESVAWVTERRDVLSTLFLIPCLLCYLRYARGREPRAVWYAASVGLLVLSLLSKAWGITLPALLLVLDFYPLRRLRWQRRHLTSSGAVMAYIDKVPYALPALWAAHLAAKAQSAGDMMKPLGEYGIADRIAQAFYGLAFYVWKTVLPTALAPIYEIPVDMNPYAGRFMIAAAAVVAVTVVLVAARKRWPAGLALGVGYAMVLSPVLGITQSGPQLVADRYSYISCMSWALLGGAALTAALGGRPRPRPGRLAAVSAGVGSLAVVFLLAVMTWQQTQVWRTSQRLWEHTLTVNANSWNAHVNLGTLYQDRGDFDEALEHYTDALVVKPDIAGALGNIALIHLERRQNDQALYYARRARELASNEPPALRQAAGVLYRLGKIDEALGAYRELIRMTPDDPVTRWDLSVALRRKGRLDEAITHLTHVVRLIERRGLVSRGNANTSHFGQLYTQACSNLRAHYYQQGDSAKARQYEDKLRTLAPTGGY